MNKDDISYEEKRFMMEFLDIWNEYGRPPIHLYTDHLQSSDRGSGTIKGLQHQFVNEILEAADALQVNVQLECLGVRGSWGTPATAVMEAEGDEEESEEDENDEPTDYSDTDQEEDENEAPTDYSAQTDEDEGDEPTDYGAEDTDEGGEDTGEGGTDDAGGEEGADTETEDDGMGGDEPTDYSADADGDDMGAEGGDTGEGEGTDTESDDTSSSDEQTDSSNINTLVKNFSLMGDFENLYSLITDSINTLNSTLKADPGQNRVLVQVSRNLASIKDFILTFIQFHFKNDNYQYNLYYYEVVIHLLKLNLAMLEKALTLGESKQEKKSKEVNKDG